jgi:hypothetical protein
MPPSTPGLTIHVSRLISIYYTYDPYASVLLLGERCPAVAFAVSGAAFLVQAAGERGMMGV